MIGRTTLAAVLVVLLLGAVLAIQLTVRPPVDLLEIENPDPHQLRLISTRLLVDDDFDTRAAAARKLASAGPDAATVLEQLALTTTRPDLLLAVLEVLRALDPKSTVAVIEHLAGHENVEIRRVVVDVAASMKHRRCRKILVAALEDTDGGVLSTAVDACGRARIRAAVPALRRLLDHPSISVRRHAARALRGLTGKQHKVR